MEQRIEFCCKALRGANFRALCREYGISAKTGYKWQERFLRDGASGMVNESRRPRSHPESLGEEELCRIVELKLAHPNWGPRKIRELYHRQHGKAASESSFKRVLERSGLTQKRKVRLATQSGRLCSLTSNALMSLLACVVPASFMSIRLGAIAAESSNWTIPR